ncbi:MAG: 50S ribosomal protein L21 [Ignavibacteria bacterium]
MFAIVNIKGKQYKLAEKQRVYIPKLKEEAGSKVSFSNVLMYSKDGKSFEIGTPLLKINVEATVLQHVKDDKVIVFKKKRRKGYKRTRGHRQGYTEIEINSIGGEVKGKRETEKGEMEAKETAKSEKAKGEVKLKSKKEDGVKDKRKMEKAVEKGKVKLKSGRKKEKEKE